MEISICQRVVCGNMLVPRASGGEPVTKQSCQHDPHHDHASATCETTSPPCTRCVSRRTARHKHGLVMHRAQCLAQRALPCTRSRGTRSFAGAQQVVSGRQSPVARGQNDLCYVFGCTAETKAEQCCTFVFHADSSEGCTCFVPRCTAQGCGSAGTECPMNSWKRV